MTLVNNHLTITPGKKKNPDRATVFPSPVSYLPLSANDLPLQALTSRLSIDVGWASVLGQDLLGSGSLGCLRHRPGSTWPGLPVEGMGYQWKGREGEPAAMRWGWKKTAY